MHKNNDHRRFPDTVGLVSHVSQFINPIGSFYWVGNQTK